MKRIIQSAALAVMIFLCVQIISSAAPPEYLLGIGDELLVPSGAVTPIYRGGKFYVPYQVFGHLGIETSYSQKTGTLVVWDGLGHGVIYVLGAQSQTYSLDLTDTFLERAIEENGRIYVPAAFTAGMLWLNYSTLEQGSVVRISKYGDITESDFLKKNKALIDKYSESTPPTAKPTPTPTPVPTVKPDEAKTIFLTFDITSVESAAEITALLRAHAFTACFFLESDMAEDDELVRALYVEGYGLGFLCDTPPDPLSSAEAYNSALRRILKTRSRLVHFPVTPDPGASSVLIENGYLCFDSPSPQYGSTVKNAHDKLISEFEQMTQPTVFFFTDDEITLTALEYVLEYLDDNDYIVSALDEASTAHG